MANWLVFCWFPVSVAIHRRKKFYSLSGDRNGATKKIMDIMVGILVIFVSVKIN